MAAAQQVHLNADRVNKVKERERRGGRSASLRSVSGEPGD